MVNTLRCNLSLDLDMLQEVTSLPDQLDEAARYIKSLQMNLERMKEKKNSLMGVETNPNMNQNTRMVKEGLKSPQFEIQQKGSALEVVLITGLDCQFMFNETIRVLYEEGADIVNASYTVVEDTVFHTMHCQVRKLPGLSSSDYYYCISSGLMWYI